MTASNSETPRGPVKISAKQNLWRYKSRAGTYEECMAEYVTDLEGELSASQQALEEARKGWDRECDDADKLALALGFSVESARTEGGCLNVPKITARIKEWRESIDKEIEQ